VSKIAIYSLKKRSNEKPASRWIMVVPKSEFVGFVWEGGPW